MILIFLAKLYNILSLVSEKRYYKPFILSMFIMFIQEFSGVNYFAVYILDIFKVSTVCQKKIVHNFIEHKRIIVKYL